MSHINDDIIIERVLDGDESQYKSLIDKYKTYALTLAANVLNNREDAEEVAQDSFVKAFKNLHTFNRSAKFSTWLYRIVTNTALTRARKKKIKTQDIDSAYALGMEPRSSLEREDRKRFVRKGLSPLNEQDRVIISLFYLNELSREEIAEVTELKTNLIKVKLHRARKRLADQLKKILKEEALSL